MLKKIFCAAFLCAAIIFVGNAKVFAQDVWIYSGGGTDYYIVTETWVMTETVKNLNTRPLRGKIEFEGYVKYVRNGSLLAKKKFHTWETEGSSYYSIDDSERTAYLSGAPKTPESKVARAFSKYCCKCFNLDPESLMR